MEYLDSDHMNSNVYFSSDVAIQSVDSSRAPSIALPPTMSAKKWGHAHAFSPFINFHKLHHSRRKFRNKPPQPSYHASPPSSSLQGRESRDILVRLLNLIHLDL